MSTPDLLPYLLKANGALLLLCAVYYLGLRRLTFFRLNRAFLLFALVFAPLCPLVDASQWVAQPAPVRAGLLQLTPDWQTLLPPTGGPTPINWLLVAYWLGVGVLGARLLLQLASLYRLHRRSWPAEFRGQPYRAVTGPVTPFAFWQTIYLNPELHPAPELPAILCHEQVHVREWHTLDVLLAQLSLLFYWFNPGVWLLRQALHENLEFNTDYRVVQSGRLNAREYQYRLLHQSVQGADNLLVSHFNFHLLKTRIAMMNKPRTAAVQVARYLLLLPVAALLTLWSCEKKAYQPEPTTSAQTRNSTADQALYFVDGARSSYEAASQLDPSAIASMSVLKGHKFAPGFNEQAFRQDFGDIGARGVVLINTKAGQNSEAARAFARKYNIAYAAPSPDVVKVTSSIANGEVMSMEKLKGRLVLVNGQEVAAESVQLRAGQVESVFVLDAQKATEKYGDKGKNGAVLITTKAQ